MPSGLTNWPGAVPFSPNELHTWEAGWGRGLAVGVGGAGVVVGGVGANVAVATGRGTGVAVIALAAVVRSVVSATATALRAYPEGIRAWRSLR
jgi:hypothetical protein